MDKDLKDKDLSKLGLHQDAILIALNFGMRDESTEESFQKMKAHLEDTAFASFHEELDIFRFLGDKRQKLAYKNTNLWGAYMTDFIKYNQHGELEAVEQSNSNSIDLKQLITDSSYMDIQIEGLIEELNILVVENPVLYAIGSQAYKALNNYEKVLKDAFKENTKIVELPHYSHAHSISDDAYVKKVHQKIL